jgi:hypothetical protein
VERRRSKIKENAAELKEDQEIQIWYFSVKKRDYHEEEA